MKTYVYIIIILLFYNIVAYTQDTTCNRTVQIKSYEKELPKEVCIPFGNYQ